MEDGDQCPPFCRVDSLKPGCPAEEDGLRVGDRILRWGEAHHLNHNNLQEIAITVRNAVEINTFIEVLVVRSSRRVTVQVTPRSWSGPGLLGYGEGKDAS